MLRVVRFAERFNFQIDDAILNYVMNNDTFRHSYEKVNPDSIKAELSKYLEMPPFHQIRAFHLLHIMGLLNPSFGV
jgi:tRNA nucleotidyltransferase/poly(A) polymerase